jgi:WhiB family redox-sensing transcriptional regulator
LKNTQPFQISSPFDGTQLCSQYDLDIFFPEEYEEKDVAQAKSVCNSCWLQDKCLSFALKTNEREGVWGGTTPRERRAIKRKASRVRTA